MTKHELTDEEYSESVRKRIGQEVVRRKSEVSAAQKETAKWRKQAEEAQDRLEAEEGEKLKADKESLPEKLGKAIEDGDTEAQTKYLTEMTENNAADVEFTRRKKEREEEKAKEPDVVDEDPPPPVHASAEAFIDRNEWFDTNDKGRKRAMELEKVLEKEGFKLGDDLYEELETRLFKEIPELAPDEEPELETEKELEPEPTPVVHASRGEGHRAKRRDTNHMSDSAVATMERYGLDPKNPNDIKGFLKYRKGV